MFGYCSNVLSTGTVNNLRNWATVSPSHAVQASLFVFPYLKKRKSIFQARGYKKLCVLYEASNRELQRTTTQNGARSALVTVNIILSVYL